MRYPRLPLISRRRRVKAFVYSLIVKPRLTSASPPLCFDTLRPVSIPSSATFLLRHHPVSIPSLPRPSLAIAPSLPRHQAVTAISPLHHHHAATPSTPGHHVSYLLSDRCSLQWLRQVYSESNRSSQVLREGYECGSTLPHLCSAVLRPHRLLASHSRPS